MNKKEDVFLPYTFMVAIVIVVFVGAAAIKDLAGDIIFWPFVKLFGIKCPMFITVKLLNNWTAWKFILSAISLALVVDSCRYVLHSYKIRNRG